MIRRYVPHRPLSDDIHFFWAANARQPHATERVLPSGSPQLVVNLGEVPIRIRHRGPGSHCSSFDGGVLAGPYSEYILLEPAPVPLMGVLFKPGGAFPFLAGVPVGELHNRHVALDSIWRTANELRERLLEAETLHERFQVLEYFLDAMRTDDPPDAAIRHALRVFRRVPLTRKMGDIAESLGMSSGKFIRTFQDRVGLTPKLHCRVRRFQAALRFIGAENRPAWSQLALECGYYDQAHMIHDFKTFSGLAPTSYSALRGEHQNHVPVAGH